MSEMLPERIYLSPPHMTGEEEKLIADAFATNWVAPLGPHVDAFEKEFAEAIGANFAVALSSGTAALHLALIQSGVGPGDVVLVSTLTFAASVNPILYLGAVPHFIDSEMSSWNMDPDLLRVVLLRYSRSKKMPKAVVLVHIYGQAANITAIAAICAEFGVTLIEDAAEALGATFEGRSPGVFGTLGIFSFNGNKMITTSGGGMVVTRDEDVAQHIRKLATQAREPVAHYEHHEVGYNYRLSNVLAAIGRGQLRSLESKVLARRRVFRRYVDLLGACPGIGFMPEATWGQHSRWLTIVTIDPIASGVDREHIRLALEAENIEARPVWFPMHRQPVFAAFDSEITGVSDSLYQKGLCLPSGSALSEKDVIRVATVIRSHLAHGVDSSE